MRTAVAAALAAAGCAGAVHLATAAPTTATPLVKNTTGWIGVLAMDGSRVAYSTQTFAPSNCWKLFTWDVASHQATLVSGPATGSCNSEQPSGRPITAVAVAGSRLAWLRTVSANTETDEYLYAARIPRPRTVAITTAVSTGDRAQGPQQGSSLGGLVGSGSVLAANSWTTDAGGAVTRASLGTIAAGRLHPIATGPDTLTAAAADPGRVAVARADGTVGIYAASGAALVTVAPPPFKAVALREDYLVVLTRANSIQVYDSHTGTLIRSWTVSAGATSLDVYGDIAVFAVWRTLEALQLSTGKQAVLAVAPRAVAGAQIEAPGVVYAYNTVRGTADIGNLVYLPTAWVRAAVS